MPSLQTRQYLGRVKQPPHRSAAYHYATVEPLIESDPNGVTWRGAVDNPRQQFPTRGFVHWHDAPGNIAVGNLWQFSIDEHPDVERRDRQEYFQLVNPIEPIEVVDLRGWADEMALRSVLTNEGIELGQGPLAPRLLLWLSSGSCVGPLLLKRTSDGRRWVIDAPAGHRDAARMPAWNPEPREMSEVMLGGSRLFLAPAQQLARSSGVQNWLPDAQVLRGILKRLRKMDRETASALKITDKLFDAYLDRLGSAGLPSIDPAVERARADRLRGIRVAIQRDEEVLSQAADALLQNEGVLGELERQVEEVRKKLLEDKRLEVDAALGSQRAELVRVESELEERRHDIRQLKDRLEQKVASFDQEVTLRLEEIARRPEAAFAENAMIRAALQPLLSADRAIRQSSVTLPVIVESPGEDSQVQTHCLTDEAALRNQIAQLALSANVSLRAALAFHATLVAGATPVLIGESAYDLIRLYASAVAGGRTLWVPTGSSLLEAQDLLGHFDASMQRIVPHAAGILDVIRDASASGNMAIVVLEGFNRAPIEAYLLPILEAAAGARMGDLTRSIPVASESVVSSDDPYFTQARVVWPPNVLLVCIPAQGSTVLPVPASAWRYLGIIDTDDRERAAQTLPTGMPIERSASTKTEVMANVWCAFASEAGGTDTEEDQAMIARFAAEWKLSRGDLATAIAVHRALRRNGLPTSEALAITVASILVPRSSVTERTIEESLRGSGAPEPSGWRLIRDEAEQLRQ